MVGNNSRQVVEERVENIRELVGVVEKVENNWKVELVARVEDRASV